MIAKGVFEISERIIMVGNLYANVGENYRCCSR